MTYFFIIFFMIICLFVNLLVYKKLVNLPSIITTIWCISLFFSLFGFYNIYIPPIEVVWYALLFLFSFNFFSILFNILTNKKYDNIIIKKIDNGLLTKILLISITGLLIICNKGLLLFLKTHDLDIVRNAFINYDSIDMHIQVLLTTTFIPLGEASFIYSIENYNIEKKINSSLLLSIIFIVLVALLTGGRSMMFFFILVALVATSSSGLLLFIKQNKKIIRMCLILVVLIIIVTSQRSFGDNSILTSVYVYFCGSFNLFGVYLNNDLVFGKELLYGNVLFGGILFPLFQFLRYVFKINILPGVYILEEEATSKYLPISPTIAINATPTSMFACIRDFGIYGLVIYPLVLSFIYTKLNKKKNINILYKSIYTYFISCCFMLHTTFYFGKFQIVSVFIYLLLIYGISSKNKRVTIND